MHFFSLKIPEISRSNTHIIVEEIQQRWAASLLWYPLSVLLCSSTLITPGFVGNFDSGLSFVASGNLCVQI